MGIARFADINYMITSPTYLRDGYIGKIQSSVNSKDSGWGIGVNKNSSILSAIGEFLERERLIKDNVEKYSNTIAGYSLLNKKITKISMERIVGGGSNIVDSCGMASHTDSFKCLFNALGEFIERQSYIFNYLSKGKGKILDIGNDKKFERMFNGVRYLEFYEISLIDDYYVVLAKGVHNGRFLIGLGSSNHMEQAIVQSIKEVCQLESNYNIMSLNIESYVGNGGLNYHDVFLKLSTEQLKEAYKYLDEKSTGQNYMDYEIKEFSTIDTLRKLNEQYHMDPLIFYLSPIRDIDTLKVIKVWDCNWFPNMCPKSYEKAVYDYVKNVTNIKLDRKCNFIPFP